jgi:hypothetical protein
MNKKFSVVFLPVIFILYGIGCQKAAENPASANTTVNTVPLVRHYPAMQINFKHVFFSYHYTDYRSDQGFVTDNTDTIPSIYFRITGDIFNFIVDSSGILSKDSLPYLTGVTNWAESYCSMKFKNVPYKMLSDSSLSCVLSGLGAGTYILDIHGNDSKNDYYPNKGNSYNENRKEEFSYVRCTDSSEIEITLNYVK